MGISGYIRRLTPGQLGFLLILVYVSGGAFKGIFAKLAYEGGGSVLAVLLWRFMLSMPVFWAVALLRLGRRELFSISAKDLAGCCAAGLFGFYGFVYCDYQGLSLISASLERIILFTYPVFVILLNVFVNREHPGRWQLVALVMVQAGLALLLLPSAADGAVDLVGELWVLASALFHAVYIISVQKYSRRVGATKFTTYAMSICFIAVAVHFAIAEPVAALQLSMQSFTSVLSMVAFSTVLPIFCLSAGIARIGASRASIISMSGPFVTLAGAHWIFGDALSDNQLWAGLAIFAGIALLEFLPRRPVPATATAGVS